jgi:acyl carrier protein
METIAQKTKRIIADALGVDKHLLTYDTQFQNDLCIDSLDFLEVITLLENEFGVAIPDEKIERIKRVGDLIKYFEETKSVSIYHYGYQAA